MTDFVSFQVEDTTFSIPKEKIPKNSLLELLLVSNVGSHDRSVPRLELTVEQFLPVINYLKEGILPEPDDLEVFDYLGLITDDYRLSSVQEEYMRANMYKEGFEENPMNTDLTYGLHEVNSEFWERFTNKKEGIKPNNLIFPSAKCVPQSWEQIQKSLKDLEFLFNIPGILVAGGRIFSALFGCSSADVDLFLYSSSEEEAIQKIEQIVQLIQEYYDSLFRVAEKYAREHVPRSQDRIDREIEYRNRLIRRRPDARRITEKLERDDFRDFNQLLHYQQEYLATKVSSTTLQHLHCKYWHPLTRIIESLDIKNRILTEIGTKEIPSEVEITRTTNAVTIRYKDLEFQVILRLYKSPSEVLHGFDVDCCSIGYDGKSIWMTNRALFALTQGYNTVNFERLSPSYSYRLVKYAVKGLSIFAPDFKRELVNADRLDFYFRVYLAARKGKQGYTFLKKLRGLDIILYAEYQYQRLVNSPRTARSWENLAKEHSDYNNKDPMAFVHYLRNDNGGQIVNDLIRHLVNTAEEYPQFSSRYLPHVINYLQRSESKFMGYTPKQVTLEKTDLESLIDYCDTTFLAHKIMTNNFLYIRYPVMFATAKRIKDVLEIDSDLYAIWSILTTVSFSQKTTFKKINPGEQMTNTFNKIVLEDHRIWYQGVFFSLTGEYSEPVFPKFKNLEIKEDGTIIDTRNNNE